MANLHYLTNIEFGFGALLKLKEECDRIGISKPLFITDAGIKSAGLLQRAIDALGGLPHATFDATPSNPTQRAVHAAVNMHSRENCDGLIAIGGGSAIDCAKGVAIAATHEGPLTRYATIEGGSPLITEKVLPLIAIPTTSGTGSELARGAVLIVDDHRKLGFRSPHLMPKSAICDPELTLGLPALLTAGTGMDAIAHCMETYMSSAFNPTADCLALDGLERGWSHIERATRDGSDREARENLMCASMHAALAFQKGMGCVHSLSHSLGGIDPRLHHGTLNAVFLPAVIRFNAGADSIRREKRLDRMARAMGLCAGDDIPNAIIEMNRRLGLPSGLASMGVQREWFERIIGEAMKDHNHPTNPRPASRLDYLEMLEKSM